MDILQYLGEAVKIIIDRPLGSRHPKFDFLYELNYGYIPNTIAGDGMEIDAYVIGVEEPIQVFKGVVKAIIFRKDDNENKLVVTKVDYEISETEIMLKTNFQEQYFETEIVILK